MELLLRIRDQHRTYGDLRALEALDFELRRGEVLGLLGPNGAGKSTTMRIISGALAPSAGAVEIDGIDLLRHPIAAKARLGYLPEPPPLYPDLTVDQECRYLVKDFGTSQSPKSTRQRDSRYCPDRPALITTPSRTLQQSCSCATPS
ncbi:MAG: ATP-binding cassette domain-containing protein [Candidatus Sedimenticola endophacoides]